MVKYFLPDETFCKSRNLTNNPSAVRDFRKFWNETLKHKLSIGCFKNDGSDELVGANVLLTYFKDDKEDSPEVTQSMNIFNFGIIQKYASVYLQFESRDCADILEVIHYLTKQFDVYSTFNVDKYLTAYGLCVNPEYRNRGIATEILKSRVPILKALDMKVTSTAFTGIGSQIAAKKAGYVDAYVISYSELEKKFPSFDFSGSVTKDFKTMVLTI